MLHLVFGRAGSGKTRLALEAAGRAAKEGRLLVLLVPEQFTFEAERALVNRFGASVCLWVEVLSFSRLASRVAAECGGQPGRALDDTGRCVLMARALGEVAGLLRVYGRQAESPSFVRALADAAGEYKTCGVTPDDFDRAAAAASGTGALRQKLQDLSLVLRTYDALLSAGLSDPLDALSLLAEKLDSCPFFRGREVMIDGFKGFTPQERAVLARIFRQAPEVTVTLCADGYAEAAGSGLFAPVVKTARQLTQLAHRCGCPAAPYARLGAPQRFEDAPGLRALEEGVFRPGASACEGKAEEIRFVSAQNVYEEARFAACEIVRLTRTGECRYGDIVLLTRGMDLYEGVLEPVFAQYGIPLFCDERRGVETHPLMALALSVFGMLTANFRQEHVLRYLKTGLAGFTVEEASRLENYVLLWDIKGAQAWSAPFTGSPLGFEGDGGEAGRAELASLNALRERLYAPVAELGRRAETEGPARALYEFLCETGARDAVTEACRALKAGGEPQLAEEYAQIWGKLVAMLDQMVLAFGGAKPTLREFAELFALAASNADLGSIPPTLDAVAAGDAERMRPTGAKIAFVLGLAEGVFPRGAAQGGLLTDEERRALQALGLELSPPAEEQALDERFTAYRAFTCASKRVYLCCPRADAAGKALRPSYFFAAARGLFPQNAVEEIPPADPLFPARNPRTAFDLLARHYGEDSPLSRTLAGVFAGDEAFRPRMEALARAAGRTRLRFAHKATARELYGGTLRLSPSRVEAFSECRFLYFCRYGLGAKPRRKAELGAPEIGTVVHFVLQRLLEQSGGSLSLPPEELDGRVRALLDEFAQAFLGGLADKSERFAHLYGTLAETVLALVRHLAEEFAQSGFSPVDYELEVGENGGVPPYELALPDGGRLLLGGKVDRVDRFEKNGAAYLRVVDYKTGNKVFALSDLLYGLNLQMFIYLFTLLQNAKGRYAPAGELLPGGVLYQPAMLPALTAPHGAAEEEIERAREKALRPNGLVLDSPEVILGMEKDGAGRFIPASVREDGGGFTVGARSSVASLSQFGILKRQIDRTLRGMAVALRDGDAAAVPVNGLGYHPCDYCDYRGVCGIGPGCEARGVFSAQKDRIWDLLKGGEGDGAELDGPAAQCH